MSSPITVDGGGAQVGDAVLIVLLILMLGATVNLWRTRYIRRRTGYITMGVLVALLVGISILMRTAGV